MSSELHSKSAYYTTSATNNHGNKTRTRRKQHTRQGRTNARYKPELRDSSSESEVSSNAALQWSTNPRPNKHRSTPQPHPRSKSGNRAHSNDRMLQQAKDKRHSDMTAQHIAGEDYYYTAERESHNSNQYKENGSRRKSMDNYASVNTREGTSSLHSAQPGPTHKRSVTDPDEFKLGDWNVDLSLDETTLSESNLSELRMKAAQMEKALRWWSECTANWREKWTKARAERNSARNEVKQLRESLAESLQESGSLKAEKAALEDVAQSLRSELEEFKTRSETSSFNGNLSFKGSDIHGNSSQVDMDSLRYGKQFNPKTFYNESNNDDKMLNQRMAGLQMKLDESTKTVQAERDAKASLNKSIENLEQELSALRQKYEELKTSKQDVVKQLVRVREANKTEMDRLNQKLEEEIESNAEADKKLQDLRSELERLQEENTLEWGKRERLETEKLQLERDSKRLRSQCDELKETLSRRQKAAATNYENELREAQDELQEARKEQAELQHLFTKQEKVLEERATEFSHCRRRAEQHEGEVRSLRARVEEIKKQQTATEDELDSSQNQVRKQLRMLEEKDDEIDKLQMQLDNLYTKIRRQAGTPTQQAFGNRLRTAPRQVNETSTDGESSPED